MILAPRDHSGQGAPVRLDRAAPVPAAGEISFRVAKDRFGALSARTNSIVGPMPIGTSAASDPRGRYESIGPTIYVADSRRCAYAEVLLGFRQQRAAVAQAAESIGWTMEDYITCVRAPAQENGIDVP